MIRAVLTLGAILGLGTTALAGVYGPNEPCPFEIVGGVVKPLPHPRLKSLLNDRRAELNPAIPEFEEVDAVSGRQKLPTARGKAMTRVRDFASRVEKLTPAERLAFSADLVRTGTTGKEEAALKRLTRERPNDYLLAANYVHAEALASNWAVASRTFEDHVLEQDSPRELPGTSPEQLAWMLSVDKSYYRKWLRVRLAEVGQKSKGNDSPYPLFPDVKFTGVELSAAERSKLPTDAVAVVQQLVLWSPTDTGLLWLLAEVYAATGQLREADDTFDMCTWGAGMTGQKLLMEHRKVVKAAVEKLPPVTADILLSSTDTTPKTEADEGIFGVVAPETLLLYGGLFAVFAIGLLALQIRAWRKRRTAG